MTITNWLKAGRRSKKTTKVIHNIHCNPQGNIGESSWDDYVMVTFYSKEKESFIRLTMTPKEAMGFNKKLTEGLKKFDQ